MASCVTNFASHGDVLNDGERNIIKTFDIKGVKVNIKSFKRPNLINRFVYRFFRKSKAQRSFEYAQRLKDLEVGTPQPFAYFEISTPFIFKDSYYISEHLPHDLTFRELTDTLDHPDHENLLRAFTRFSYQLHQKGINFLDHSPGNTLIQKNSGKPKFFLVDLNRMCFESMDFNTRMKNLSKLTIHESVVKTMSNEYAKCSGEDEQRIFETLWKDTQDFQYRFHRKRKLKKKLKFWK
ncbi:MAG: Kdo domain containing protein [Flavobacteriaceae bacterium]|nr:Kdo domain containing protein [Bacteroidia bacterium]NNL62044.1 Kdo domain containing protein [Flavobacteriaceae bacterium]